MNNVKYFRQGLFNNIWILCLGQHVHSTRYQFTYQRQFSESEWNASLLPKIGHKPPFSGNIFCNNIFCYITYYLNIIT